MQKTALAALLALVTTPALGQPACGPRAEVLGFLASEYREAPVAMGLGNGGVIEILASPDGATWTALLTRPDGLSCLVATGKHWEFVPAIPAGKPS